jgi:hypothetical protein
MTDEEDGPIGRTTADTSDMALRRTGRTDPNQTLTRSQARRPGVRDSPSRLILSTELSPSEVPSGMRIASGSRA